MVSIVILNWNSSVFLERCLASVRSDKADASEVIVVDNGSEDIAVVRHLCASLGVDRLIENRTNLGVAKGRNVGVASTSDDIICILDVDTVVKGGSIRRLADALRKDESIGVIAPRLEAPNGQLQFSCRLFPTVLTQLLRWIPWADWYGCVQEYELRHYDHSRAGDVDAVIGACQVFRKSLFDELNGFHEFSRFGYEDFDFCLRVWLTGKRVVYFPAACVEHFEQRVARRLWHPLTYAHIAALWKFFWKHKYFASRKGIYQRIARRTGRVLHAGSTLTAGDGSPRRGRMCAP
jgi:GT2 family glycosyltransferase